MILSFSIYFLTMEYIFVLVKTRPQSQPHINQVIQVRMGVGLPLKLLHLLGKSITLINKLTYFARQLFLMLLIIKNEFKCVCSSSLYFD